MSDDGTADDGHRDGEGDPELAWEMLGARTVYTCEGFDVVECVGVYSHFWDTASVAGAESRHTVNVAYRVRQRDPDAAVELDDQHDDCRFVAADDPDLHDYCYQYFADADL